LPGFKSSVTEVFIKKGEDIISKQMENHLWIWNLGNLQQEAAKSGESALQEHASHKMTYREIRLAGCGSEAAVMQKPNITVVVETYTSRPRPDQNSETSSKYPRDLWIMPIFF